MIKNNNLQKLQKVEYMILRDVTAACDNNGLTYYLIGGTLLGAVRHKGFIPWDDDIDIVMPRKDYRLLPDIMSKEYGEKYFIQRFDVDANYTRYIFKVRLNGTKNVENANENIEMHQGIYIDIFPIDNVVNNRIKLFFRGGLLRLLFAYKNIIHCKKYENDLKKALSSTLRLFLRIIPEKCINDLFEWVCTQDEEKKCDFCTNFASHFKWKKQLYPNSYFGEGVFLKFEDDKFRCPNEYNKILERLYGDYMQLPPEEKRVAHNIVNLDLGNYENNI